MFSELFPGESTHYLGFLLVSLLMFGWVGMREMTTVQGRSQGSQCLAHVIPTPVLNLLVLIPVSGLPPQLLAEAG